MKKLIIAIFLITISMYPQTRKNFYYLLSGDGSSYTAEASALFARMNNQPDATRKALIDNTVLRLKNNSLFTGFDALWVTAAHDSQSALLNWIENDHNLTAYKSITFIADSGFKGKTSDSSYLNCDFIPSSDGINYTKLNASIGTYTVSNITEDHTFQLGASNGGSETNPATGSIWRTDQLQTKINDGTGDYSDVYTGGKKIGLLSMSRTDSLTRLSYFNGILQVTDGTAATGSQLSTSPFHILNNGHNNANNSGGTVALAWVGRSFNSTEMDSLYSIFYDYLNGVGCADSWNRDTIRYNNFEGSGYDNYTLWTESGTVNEDYTTTVLEGSQSLYMATSANAITRMYHIGDTVNVFFMFRVEDATPAAVGNIVYMRDVGGSNICSAVRLNTNGTLAVYSGSTTSNGTTVLSDNTTYYCWVKYIKGTGSNSVTIVWINTSGTKPVSPEKSITNGNATYNMQYFKFYAAGSNTIFDKFYVSPNTIGNQ